MFSIEPVNSPRNHFRIVADGLDETWPLVTKYWSVSEYVAHWIKAVQIILNGAERSALIVDYAPPSQSGGLTWFPMYRQKNESVVLQHHLLFFEGESKKFTAEKFSDFVPAYESISEDGQKVSEWRINVSDLRKWLESVDANPIPGSG
jgi:hypothetical protein